MHSVLYWPFFRDFARQGSHVVLNFLRTEKSVRNEQTLCRRGGDGWICEYSFILRDDSKEADLTSITTLGTGRKKQDAARKCRDSAVIELYIWGRDDSDSSPEYLGDYIPVPPIEGLREALSKHRLQSSPESQASPTRAACPRICLVDDSEMGSDEEGTHEEWVAMMVQWDLVLTEY